MKVIILAGGMGARLWPLSRKLLPKQFVPLPNLSTYQHTLLSVALCESVNEIIVVCPKELMATAKAQARTCALPIPVEFVDEGEPKGTLNATLVGMGAPPIQQDNVLVMSSDAIMDKIVFAKAVKEGEKVLDIWAKWVIFGIPVTGKNPNYGHFVMDTSYQNKRVEIYVEKPKNPTWLFKKIDQKYWFWNAGIFLFNPAKMFETMFSLYRSKPTHSKMPIDAVTEYLIPQGRVFGIPMVEAEWADYGTWDSFFNNLINQGYGNSNHNVTIGNVGITKCKNTLIYSTNDVPVIGIGLEDIIVANTGDAILVTTKGCTEELKETVQKIGSAPEATQPFKEEKPWGEYEVLYNSNNLKIKKIIIHPGQETSLQMHKKRTETLFVISGEVTVGEPMTCEQNLYKNDSTIIMPCTKHQISNHSKEVAILIEIQEGCIDEADIIRINDKYGREDL